MLIGVHEAGHFVAARWMHVKVLRFSIGFGKPLFLWKGKHGTEYVIAWLPLGGYVRLLNSREDKVDPEEHPRAFDHQPLWRRSIIVFAGPFINLVFAVLAFYLAYTLGIETIKPVIAEVTPASIAFKSDLKPGLQITQLRGIDTHNWGDVSMQLLFQLGNPGTLELTAKPFPDGPLKTYILNLDHWKLDPLKPDLVKSLGIEPYRPDQPAVIGSVEIGQAAEKAGLKAGDKITAFNGEKVKDWPDLVQKIWKTPGAQAVIQFERSGKSSEIQIFVESRFSFKQFKKSGYLGIRPEAIKWPEGMKYELKYPFYQALGPAFKETFLFFRLNAVTLGKIVIGKISVKNLGGPVLIYQAANLAFKQGFVIFLNFLAIVSVMLGFVNLLPIPGLDGGHLLYFAIEKIRGKPLSVRLEALLIRLGMIALVILMVQVTINDLMRLAT